MLPRPASRINAEHIEFLIDNDVLETKEIEYKRELSKDDEGHKKKFLKETTSFANTRSGHLILGLDENDGEVELYGLSIDQKDIESEIRGWEQILQSCVKPRLPGYEIVNIEIGGETVLVVQVLNSSLAPHRVERKRHREFYGRDSNGSYPLDVDEVREMVLLSDRQAE